LVLAFVIILGLVYVSKFLITLALVVLGVVVLFIISIGLVFVFSFGLVLLVVLDG
jgi:hypothetical protein